MLHSAEKNPKVSLKNPLGTSGFVGFLEKVKKGVPFTLIRFCMQRLKSKKAKGDTSVPSGFVGYV